MKAENKRVENIYQANANKTKRDVTVLYKSSRFKKKTLVKINIFHIFKKNNSPRSQNHEAPNYTFKICKAKTDRISKKQLNLQLKQDSSIKKNC